MIVETEMTRVWPRLGAWGGGDRHWPGARLGDDLLS